MFFSLIAIVSLIGLILGLTFLRFRAEIAKKEKYFSWLGRGFARIFKPSGLKQLRALYENWVLLYYPGWTKWVFFCLVVSFCYLAASGFAFALLSSRGMYGVFLLLHVSAGGLFALSLSAVLVLRAKDYVLENISKADVQKIFFWIFVISGLLLILTALSSMLSLFTLSTQVVLSEVHRYSALCALLTAVVFIDMAVVPRGK
jgi:hypothetical protein